MTNANNPAKKWVTLLIFLGMTAGVFILGLLGSSILERRQEARIQPPLQQIDEFEPSAQKWGENYPYEYSRYLLMKETSTKTRYGGSFPRDYLEETPANCILFAGYPFSLDYLQARGHIYAVEDVKKTRRINNKTAATCLTCKSPNVVKLLNELTPEKFYASNFHDLKDRVVDPIGCLDCHEPNTMKLRISRPALIEALQRQGRDLNAITHQEMRSLVCAQCHVEYYFKGSGNYLTFPWDNGFSIESIDTYYEKEDFTDFTNAISKTKMVKEQHPDYEIYTTGIHSYRNVACADCHMPFMSEGGMKFTDHYLRSPLLNITNSCAVCHRWSEDEIKQRVESIQDKVRQARSFAERNISYAHFDIAACLESGASDQELETVRSLVRKAQLRWDFIAAHNGMGFHSPQECMRILGISADLAQEARVTCTRILAQHGYTEPLNYPDFTSKEKAQNLIKLWVDGTPPKLLSQAKSTGA